MVNGTLLNWDDQANDINYCFALRLIQTCVKRMRLRSKIENFLTDHVLRMH